MIKDNPDSTPESLLRYRAELRVKGNHEQIVPGADTARRLLHELQVYQVELEMQNEELRQARAGAEAILVRYTELYDFAPIGYFTFDRNGMVCQANLAGAALLAMNRAELIDQNFKVFLAGENRNIFNSFLERIFSCADKQQCDLEIAIEKAASHFVHIEARADGKYRTCRAVVIDLTEQKHFEQNMQASELKYRSLFENSRDAIMTISLPAWEFTSANKSAVQMFSVASEAEFYSLSPMDVSPEFQPDGLPSADKAKQMVDVAMQEGVNLFEWVFKRLDGTTFPAEVLLTRMELDGKVFIHGALRDISARKKLEREVQERRNEMELLQKRQVAAQTAAAIAHELNQPLLALASYSEAARMMLDAGNPDLDKIRHMVEASERQALRAGQSIRELLEFLNMDEFPTAAFDLNGEILDALDIARAEHELQFNAVLRLKNGLPLVRANRTHVKKVLLNLLHNSIDAMQEIGVPLPSVTVTVSTIKDENIAQVTIRDNGPGIKAEDVRRLFEPFFTTKATGIGMGLAISRSLIEANGGQLWVDPQEGPGAIFHFTLPFAS